VDSFTRLYLPLPMVNDAGMFKRKSPHPTFLCSFVLVTAVALSVSAARFAQAGDPTPSAAKADDKAAPKAKPAPAAKAAPAPASATEPTKEVTKEVTVKGEMTCAKCGLHESAKCQNVLRVKEAGGKETKYYLAKNPVSDEHHQKVCSGSAPATVTGKGSDEKGKKIIAASAVKYD
jgi:hypothetical protein